MKVSRMKDQDNQNAKTARKMASMEMVESIARFGAKLFQRGEEKKTEIKIMHAVEGLAEGEPYVQGYVLSVKFEIQFLKELESCPSFMLLYDRVKGRICFGGPVRTQQQEKVEFELKMPLEEEGTQGFQGYMVNTMGMFEKSNLISFPVKKYQEEENAKVSNSESGDSDSD